MRIVHLTQTTTTEVTGGLEYHVQYLSAALACLGHEVIVVSTNKLTSANVSAGAAPISSRAGSFVLPKLFRHQLDSFSETLTMFGRRWWQFRHASRIAEYVDKLEPDLVHQHSYIGELRACRLIVRKYPLVFTNHTGAYLHLQRWAPTRFLQRRLMKRFTMTIAPSRELLPDTENSHYVPNGVDTTTFFPFSNRERGSLKLQHGCAGKHVFLCARRWAPTKGIVYLARALRHLSRWTRENSVFLFCGNETPGYSKYQRNIRCELAASECDVRILGNLDHKTLAEIINFSCACLFPSLMEATSLACLESMACGTPVIGTRTGGLLELIQEGENGWLVPTRDAPALAERIDGILSADLETMLRTRQRALDTICQHYTWDAAAVRTEKIYQDAVHLYSHPQRQRQ